MSRAKTQLSEAVGSVLSGVGNVCGEFWEALDVSWEVQNCIKALSQRPGEHLGSFKLKICIPNTTGRQLLKEVSSETTTLRGISGQKCRGGGVSFGIVFIIIIRKKKILGGGIFQNNN